MVWISAVRVPQKHARRLQRPTSNVRRQFLVSLRHYQVRLRGISNFSSEGFDAAGIVCFISVHAASRMLPIPAAHCAWHTPHGNSRRGARGVHSHTECSKDPRLEVLSNIMEGL